MRGYFDLVKIWLNEEDDTPRLATLDWVDVFVMALMFVVFFILTGGS